MVTKIALFTRDLRVHDNPVLAGAAANRTVPVFVLDERLLSSPFNRPNRAAFLVQCLADLRRSLTNLGGGLVVCRGDPAVEVTRLAHELNAAEVHMARDVSAFAQERERRLRDLLAERRCELVTHDAVTTAVPPGELTPMGRDHFAVFTPYLRRWSEMPRRRVLPPPADIRLPRVKLGRLPSRREISAGDVSPDLPTGGESAGRQRMAEWLGTGVFDYAAKHDDLSADGTSRLSPYLHFGCISAVELLERLGSTAGESAFARQLAWRDFHHQVLSARPRSSWADYRDRGTRWREDPEALEAWKAGRTGVPIVDAGMRQLAREGWMHNRARLITASFLTKTLQLDWRLGAQHFIDLLVDADIANNNLNWQWVAGTGTDTRPNRVLNPIRQARRYDPHGHYVRRYVPEA
jgi:deoxyribodipyrimidine photo-lyase